jgi:hypothetical protein
MSDGPFSLKVPYERRFSMDAPQIFDMKGRLLEINCTVTYHATYTKTGTISFSYEGCRVKNFYSDGMVQIQGDKLNSAQVLGGDVRRVSPKNLERTG